MSLTMESAAREIEQWEHTLDGKESAAWWPLAHARKEYGHASAGGNQDYYLRIVERDLHHTQTIFASEVFEDVYL